MFGRVLIKQGSLIRVIDNIDEVKYWLQSLLYFLAACDSLDNCGVCKDDALVCDTCSSGYTANNDKNECGGE